MASSFHAHSQCDCSSGPSRPNFRGHKERRTSFSPDLIFYDFFKDKSKEEKEELEKVIKESRNQLRKLQKQYESMQDEHIQLKNENELNYKNLKFRHEKDLRIGLLGLNKIYRKQALKDVCPHVLTMGRKFCKLLQLQ